MFTSLDLLIVAFMGLAAASLLSVCLMFLLKNKTAQRVCLYVVAVMGLYVAYIGMRIALDVFIVQLMVAILVALASIGAFVLERVAKKKNNETLFLIARILAAAALVVGLANAFLF